MHSFYHDLFLIMMPGWGELIIIFLILLLVFGAKRLPEIAKGLGKGIKEFKKAITKPDDDEDDIHPSQDSKQN